MSGPAKTIRIMCPNLKCRSILVVPDTARGKNVKCSNCATLFKIPATPPTGTPNKPANAANAPA